MTKLSQNEKLYLLNQQVRRDGQSYRQRQSRKPPNHFNRENDQKHDGHSRQETAGELNESIHFVLHS